MANDLFVFTFDTRTKTSTVASRMQLGDGSVDAENCVIRGVSVITSGIEAKGHALQVDAKTVDQLYKLGRAKKQVKVKTNHGSGADAINGYLTAFRIDGDRLRADWHLMKAYPNTAHMLEMAERMPQELGFSVAFRGEPEKVGGKKAARATELVSADLVESPAANPTGMFSARVDNGGGSMAKQALNKGGAPGAEGGGDGNEETVPAWAQSIIDGQQQIAQRLDGIEQFQNDLQQELEGMEQEGDEGDEGDEEDLDGDPGGDGQGATEMSARQIQRYIDSLVAHRLETRFSAIQQQEEEEAEEQAFEVLEAKVTELSEALEAALLENQALNQLNQEYRKSGGGGKPVSANVTLFSEKPGKAAGQTEFEARANELYHELREKDKTLTEFSAKAEATKKAIAEDESRYETHLQEKGLRKKA